jgi:hypothetical protein
MNKNLLVPIMNRKAKRVCSDVADVQLDLGGVVFISNVSVSESEEIRGQADHF